MAGAGLYLTVCPAGFRVIPFSSVRPPAKQKLRSRLRLRNRLFKLTNPRAFLLKGSSGPLILVVLKWNHFFFLRYFCHHKWLVVSEDLSVEELETLPA